MIVAGVPNVEYGISKHVFPPDIHGFPLQILVTLVQSFD